MNVCSKGDVLAMMEDIFQQLERMNEALNDISQLLYREDSPLIIALEQQTDVLNEIYELMATETGNREGETEQ